MTILYRCMIIIIITLLLFSFYVQAAFVANSSRTCSSGVNSHIRPKSRRIFTSLFSCRKDWPWIGFRSRLSVILAKDEEKNKWIQEKNTTSLQMYVYILSRRCGTKINLAYLPRRALVWFIFTVRECKKKLDSPPPPPKSNSLYF